MPVAVLEIRDWMDVMSKDLGVRTDRNRLAWERAYYRELGWGFGWLGGMNGSRHMNLKFIRGLCKSSWIV